MNYKNLSLIVAVSEDNVIGISNDMPWSLPDDLLYFSKQTKNKVIIMGKNTFLSMNEKILPHRYSIIVSSQANASELDPKKGVYVTSLEESLLAAKSFLKNNPDFSDEIMIIGGGKIYRSFLKFVNRVYLTRVHTNILDRVNLPYVDFVLNKDEFTCVNIDDTFKQDKGRNEYSFSFEIWERN